jgi:hypothetical protein
MVAHLLPATLGGQEAPVATAPDPLSGRLRIEGT